MWTGVPSPDGEPWEQGALYGALQFPKGILPEFLAHTIFTMSFGYYDHPHFMDGETGLKPLAQTHDANTQHQGWARVRGWEEGGRNWSWWCDREEQWWQWGWGVLKRCAL